MKIFKTPAQGKAELERWNHLSDTERIHESNCNIAPALIEESAKRIPVHLKQFMRINIDLFDIEPDVWSIFHEYHSRVWSLRRNYRITDQMLVYHLGLANLAGNIDVLKNDVENRTAFLQRLFILQFGTEIPDPFRELNMLESYPECIDGFTHVLPKQNGSEAVKDAIRKLIETPARNESFYSHALNAYVNGCIRVMCDLIGSICLSHPDMRWDLPVKWQDEKDRTIGDVFDDYLSKLKTSNSASSI